MDNRNAGQLQNWKRSIWGNSRKERREKGKRAEGSPFFPKLGFNAHLEEYVLTLDEHGSLLIDNNKHQILSIYVHTYNTDFIDREFTEQEFIQKFFN